MSNTDNKITVWLARDNNGQLWEFENEPIYEEIHGQFLSDKDNESVPVFINEKARIHTFTSIHVGKKHEITITISE